MSYTTEQLFKVLKEARQSQGLSQRALSAKSGVPQGHISKIENGAVDLRFSSIIAIARALGLELTLIPRKYVGMTQAMMNRIDEEPPRPAYSLEDDE